MKQATEDTSWVSLIGFAVDVLSDATASWSAKAEVRDQLMGLGQRLDSMCAEPTSKPRVKVDHLKLLPSPT